MSKLGFYSDDWYYTALFQACGDRSVPGLFNCLFASEQNRPLFALHWALLYRLFGPTPLPYHIWGMILHAACAVLLYLVFTKIGLPRAYSLAAALLWATLPHYSSDRFWIATFQATLSLALFLAGVLAALRIPESTGARRAIAAVLSLTAFVASLLAYEVCLPLLAIVPFLLWYRHRFIVGETRSPSGFAKAAVPYLFGLAVVGLGIVVYKFLALGGIPLGERAGALRSIGPLLIHAAQQSFDFNFGTFGAALPAIAIRAASCVLDRSAIFAATAIGVATAIYFAAFVKSRGAVPSRRFFAAAITVGLVIFGLGYSMFAPSPHLELATVGPSNRVNVAMAVGAAALWAGLFGLICSLSGSPRTSILGFALLVAIFAASGTAVVEGAAWYWTEAVHAQAAVFDDLRARFPDPPRDAVILIDGVCPYTGPAPGFKTNWDASGALRISYPGRFDLRGDLISPSMEIGDNTVTIRIDRFKNTYPYSASLFVYNHATKELLRLTSRNDAARYFQSSASSFHGGCGARDGYGTSACFLP